MNARFPAIKNETASSGIPEAARHRSVLDIIIPEYKRPSGFLVFAPARVFGRIRYCPVHIVREI